MARATQKNRRLGVNAGPQTSAPQGPSAQPPTGVYWGMVLIIAILVGLAVGFIGQPPLALGATVAVAVMGGAFKYPRQGLVTLLIYLPFSGTVTYALGGSHLLQLAKDLIYLPAIVGVWCFCRRTRQPLVIPPLIKWPLLGLVALCLLILVVVNGGQQLVAVEGESPLLVGGVGLKVLLGYVLIIPWIYYGLRDRDQLDRLFRLQVGLILICCGLGLIQFWLLRTGVCQGTVGEGEALFRASLEARCFVGGSLLYAPEQGQIRLPGTFNAPWQWGWFLISGSFFAFATAFCDRSPLWRGIGLLTLGAVGIMAVVSGQRIAMALVPLTVIGLLLVTGQVVNLKRVIPVGIGLALVIGIFVAQNPAMVSDRWESFQDRWVAAPPQTFMAQQWQWAWAEQRGLLGRGVGRATNAARLFGETELVETYHPKLLYELGPLGLLAVVVFYLTLAIAVWQAYRSLDDPSLSGYGAVMAMFVLFISLFPYYYPLDVDPVNIYYWLAAGIVLKLPVLERREQSA